MNEIIFTVYGEPMGKQRPKFSRQGNTVRTYTPSRTAAYEAKVRQAFNWSGGVNFWCGKDEYFSLHMICYFPVPKSASKKAREQMLALKPTIFPKKPDCDNIAKIVADALNEVAYYDDSRMHELCVVKRYTSLDPRVVVRIFKSGGEESNELPKMD